MILLIFAILLDIAIKGLNKLLFVEDLKFTFLKNLASFRFTGYCSGDLRFILN